MIVTRVTAQTPSGPRRERRVRTVLICPPGARRVAEARKRPRVPRTPVPNPAYDPVDTVTDRPVYGLPLGWPFVILGRTPPPDGGARVPPYRRRRRTPWVVVVSVLAVLAVTTWTVVLIGAGGSSGVTSCPAPTGSGPSGQVVDPGALDAVAPVPPSAARVRVFNAGGQRGQANLVAAQLGDLGFPEAAPPDNDPLYPDGNMECVGQLRFGPAGQGAARTLALVLPCTELVRDDRTDDAVDVSVGTGFRDVNPPRAVRNALEQIGTGGGTDGSANADPTDPAASTAAAPGVDPTVLETARNTAC